MSLSLIAQRAEQRQAVHPRHDEVRNDDAGPEGRHLLQGFLAVGRAIGQIAPGTDEFRQTVARRAVVLDYEDALRDGAITDRSSGLCRCSVIHVKH